MFDIGWGELVVIGIVALIAIGPKELPGVLRSLGHWMGKIRSMASEFQGQFQEAMREAEMTDLKKHVDDINTAASSVTNFDPLADAQKHVDAAFEEKPAAADAPPAATEPATPTPAPPTASATADTPPAVAKPPSHTMPTSELHLPLPEPLPPMSEKDFAPAAPNPPKQAGGGQAA